MRFWSILFACLLVISVFAVDESKFKKCSNSGFCMRHRSKPTVLKYTVIPSSVAVQGNILTAGLTSTKHMTTELEMTVQILPNDLIRVRMLEQHPYKDRHRFEATDVLIPEKIEAQTMTIVSKDNKRVVVASANKRSRLEIDYSPFHLAYYVDEELKITVNDKNLFYFEVTRGKSIEQSETKETKETVEVKEQKKIVDYTEAGHAIYEDGTIEGEGEGENEAVAVEGAETSSTSRNGTPMVGGEDNNNNNNNNNTEEEKEDESGYWEEYFGGKTDSKPWGPQSVGMDITFHGVEGLYGIPQHSSSYRLQTTVNGPYTDPYRLFNLDVFEYATNRPSALYGSVPFMIGAGPEGASGLFWLNPTDTFIDIFAPANGNQASQWMFEAGVIDLFFLPGPSQKTLLDEFTQLTARAMLPPFFSIGYHQSRWNYLDEKDVDEVSSKFEELNFPYDVIWLDIEHTDGKKYFTWDKNNFKDPKAMVEKLSAHGHKLVTVVDPHVKRENGYRVYDELTANDFFLKKNDGSVFDGWCWPGSSSWPDYTNPDVRKYYGDQFAYEKYEGTTADVYTWNDMNEPSVFDGPEVTMPRDVVNGRGEEHREWHNIYGYYYHTACTEGQRRREPENRPFVLSRSFYAGSQRNGPIWTGDIFANWEHMEATIPMLLSLGVAGISFTGSDVPGFFKDPTEELAIRWYQFGAWMPFFRAHAHIDTKRREPWTFSKETCALLREATLERYAYLPYIYTSFWQTHRNGSPLTRPLMYMFPEDKQTYDMDKVYMFGEAMLILPVVSENAREVTSYFPAGDWYSIHDKSVVNGGAIRTVPAPLHYTPVYQRAGTVVALQTRVRRSASQMKHDPFTLHVVADGLGNAEGYIYHDNRDGFGYEKGDYAYMKVEMKNGVVRCTRDEKGTYEDDNMIERIVLRVRELPKSITIVAGGKRRPALVMVDEKALEVTVRKPGIRLTEEWEMTLQ